MLIETALVLAAMSPGAPPVREVRAVCDDRSEARGADGGLPPAKPVVIRPREVGPQAGPCRFAPRRITVRPGTRVRWVDADATYHTITATRTLRRKRPSGAFQGVVAAEGAAYTRRFRRPGTYRYYCQPHAGFMDGIVRVKRRR